MNISNDLNEFISKHINLIEDKDLGALRAYLNKEIFLPTDIYQFYDVLGYLYDYSEWLRHTNVVPYGFITDKKLNTLEIPSNIDSIEGMILYNSDIDVLRIKDSQSMPIRLYTNFIVDTLVNTFISDRELDLVGGAFSSIKSIKTFQINKDVHCSKFTYSPFHDLYKKNPNMHFIVNNDTALVVVRKRFSLPEHLHDCGFKNVTVV